MSSKSIIPKFASNPQFSQGIRKVYTIKFTLPLIMSSLIFQNEDKFSAPKPKKKLREKVRLFMKEKSKQLYFKSFSTCDCYVWIPSKVVAMDIDKYVNKNHKSIAIALNWIEFQVLLFNRWLGRMRGFQEGNVMKEKYEEYFVYVSFVQALVLSFFVFVLMSCLGMLYFVVEKLDVFQNNT